MDEVLFTSRKKEKTKKKHEIFGRKMLAVNVERSLWKPFSLKLFCHFFTSDQQKNNYVLKLDIKKYAVTECIVNVFML